MRTYNNVGSHVRLHLQVPLTWAYANCLTTVAAQIVSRNAAFPISALSGTPCDQAVLSTVATHDIWNENMSLAVRLYNNVGSQV